MMRFLRCVGFALLGGWRQGLRGVLAEFLQRWCWGGWRPLTSKLWRWATGEEP